MIIPYFPITSCYGKIHNIEDTRCCWLKPHIAAMLLNLNAPLITKHPGRVLYRPLLAACVLLNHKWNNAEHPSFSISNIIGYFTFVTLVTEINSIGIFKISTMLLQWHPQQNCLICSYRWLLMTCRVFATTTDDVTASWRAVLIRGGKFQTLPLVTPFQVAR